VAELEIESEVQGNVWKVMVTPGTQVAAGELLLIIESMKMEIPVEAPVAGTVLKLLVAPEQAVAEDQLLVVLDTA
jgi:biotin carboxyl carrier protein